MYVLLFQIKHTDKSETVKLLAPGHLMPAKRESSILRKRKKKETNNKEEVSMN